MTRTWVVVVWLVAGGCSAPARGQDWNRPPDGPIEGLVTVDPDDGDLTMCLDAPEAPSRAFTVTNTLGRPLTFSMVAKPIEGQGLTFTTRPEMTTIQPGETFPDLGRLEASCRTKDFAGENDYESLSVMRIDLLDTEANPPQPLWAATYTLLCERPGVFGLPEKIDFGESQVGGPKSERSFALQSRNACPIKYLLTPDKPWIVAIRDSPGMVLTDPAKPEIVTVVGECQTVGTQRGRLIMSTVPDDTPRARDAFAAELEMQCKPAGPEISEISGPRVVVSCGACPGEFSFQNEGSVTLEYKVEPVTGPFTVTSGAEGKVAPGGTATVGIETECKGVQTITGSLVVNNNDADESAKPVPAEVKAQCGKTGTSWGDPHLITIDGLMYDFQAVGEFVLAEDGDLMVQVRQQPFAGSKSIAANTAVAARVGKTRVAFYAGQDPPLRVDGKQTAVDGKLALAGGGELRRAGDDFTVSWPSGEQLYVDMAGRILHVKLTLPDADRGKVRGLLGNFDGDATNELATRAGKAIPTPPSFSQLHDDYADSWRIKQADSLFDYASGESTATFTDLDFPRSAATTASLAAADRKKGESACRKAGVKDPGLFDSCVLDVALGGDPGLARAAARAGGVTATVTAAAFYDFEQGAGAEWSKKTVDTTPGTTSRPAGKFLGRFGNDKVTLSLDGLAAHDSLQITFDLFVIQSWDGNENFGPDVWDLSVDGVSALHTTFANWPDAHQAYPDAHPGGDHPLQTGALEVGTLGYQWEGRPMDAAYRITVNVPHRGASAKLVFSGSGLQELADESWGLDNVSVGGYASGTVAAADIAGTWAGHDGKLLLRVEGTKVKGVYEHDKGTFVGTWANGVVTGWWAESPSYTPDHDAGEAELHFAREGDRLKIDGRWRYGTTGAWSDDWDFELTDKAPPPALVKRLDTDTLREHP